METENSNSPAQKPTFDKTKIILTILLIASLIALGGMVTHYFTNSQNKGKLETLLTVYLPMEQSMREVEVSIWETATAVMEYLHEPSSKSLTEYKKQLNDVQTFIGKYKQLAQTEAQKQVIAKFDQQWAVIVALSEQLLSSRDKMEHLLEKSWNAVHQADDVIDYKIQAALIEGTPDLLKKERYLREVEVSLWEANNVMNYYVHSPAAAQKEFTRQMEDIKEFWGKYKALSLSEAERKQAKAFETQWAIAVKNMQTTMQLAQEIRKDALQFMKLIHQIDDLVDFEIQMELTKQIKALAK